MKDNSKIMLLIEDDDETAALITESFCEIFDQCLVVRVTTGESGLEYITQGLPKGLSPQRELPDIVFLDTSLPGMSGMECLKQLRQHPRSRGIPVVVLADDCTPHMVCRAYELGAASFFRKPRILQDFIVKLTELNMYWSQTAEVPTARRSEEHTLEMAMSSEAEHDSIQ
jgi:two-component system response regulator